MFKNLFFPSLAFALLTTVSTANADLFEPKMSMPKSYKDVLDGVQEVRDNIASVQCGGFAAPSNTEINGTGLSGSVPIPDLGENLPGRSNNIGPLPNAIMGMGTRGDFKFPPKTFGYLSACDVVSGVVDDQDLAKLHLDVKWDINGGDDPEKTTVTFHTEPGDGHIDVNPQGWCKRYPKATPAWCRKLFDVLTQQLNPYLHSLPIQENPLCPEPPKKYCTDYTMECHGEQCRTPEDPSFNNKITECHLEDDGQGGLITVIDLQGQETKKFSSFYRHYGSGNFGDTFEVSAPNVDKKWNVRGECYEYYQEIDPKDIVTTGPGDGGGKDNMEQCELVIATPDEKTPDTPEWPKEKPDPDDPDAPVQSQKTNVPDPAPADPARDAREAPEPWVADKNTSIALVDMKKVREKQKAADDPADITGLMGAIIPVKQRASELMTADGRTDTFDDAGERTLSAFWEAQQRVLLKMITDPTIRLIMPARFLTGLDDKSPLFQYVRGAVTKPDGIVELTLHAGSDDLGNVIRALLATYVMPVREVRIPILVPLASEGEIDTRIAEWQHWQKLEEADAKANDRSSFSKDADPLIERLKSYKAALGKERGLREALALRITKLFEPLKKFDTFMAEWYRENTAKINEVAVHSKERKQLKNIWRHIQNSML